MPITFSADEAFTMAEQIEKNGAKFYRKAAKANAGARDMLNQLADMEDRHLKTFSEMHKEVTGSAAEPIAADPLGEAGLFAEAMAGNYVFDRRKDPSEILKGGESITEIVRIALGLEKDSIVFYLGLKDMVPRLAGKDKLDVIIKEEMKHIATLNQMLASKR